MHAAIENDKLAHSTGIIMLIFLTLAFFIGLSGELASQEYSYAVNSPTVSTSASTKGYSSGSWGEGIVVPENAKLSSGSLSWEDARNVSVLFQVPNINSTDNTIYAILSLMTQSDTILQVAAGLDPNQTSWLVYVMYISNPMSYPQKYEPVLLGGKPAMHGGNTVSVSVYFENGTWKFSVSNLSTNRSVSSEFSSDLNSPLKGGDQEVFALEAYTSSSWIFQNMGNLSMFSILINGQRLLSGWYYYGSWSGSHTPLFVVGGLNPPSFISVQDASNATSVWSFGGLNKVYGYQGVIDLRTLISVIILLGWGAMFSVVLMARRSNKKHKQLV